LKGWKRPLRLAFERPIPVSSILTLIEGRVEGSSWLELAHERPPSSISCGDYDDDDLYLRLQHGNGLHNLVYMSYVKDINPAKRHK
jgi:hypothetical protein